MTKSPAERGMSERFRPWVALVTPALTWFCYELGLAGALRMSCVAVGAGLGLGWGVASLMGCAFGAWLAWPLCWPAGETSPRWLARVAFFASGVFAVAIVFQAIATLIIPPCAR